MHEIRGATCAKDFLDEICEKYGAEKGVDSAGFKPPIVKLLAHNITYDLSFLWEYLARCQTIEKGTSVICGSASAPGMNGITNGAMNSTMSTPTSMISLTMLMMK